MIAEECKIHYVLIKGFNRFMYDHILQNNTIRYCLEAFNTAETLKNHVNDCFKVNGKVNGRHLA